MNGTGTDPQANGANVSGTEGKLAHEVAKGGRQSIGRVGRSNRHETANP